MIPIWSQQQQQDPPAYRVTIVSMSLSWRCERSPESPLVASPPHPELQQQPFYIWTPLLRSDISRLLTNDDDGPDDDDDDDEDDAQGDFRHINITYKLSTFHFHMCVVPACVSLRLAHLAGNNGDPDLCCHVSECLFSLLFLL